MQQPASSQPSPAPPSFAGLLEALATPPKVEAESFWREAELAEDVATLTYDRALRKHARYRPADRGDEARPAAAATSTSEAAGGLKIEPAALGALPALADKSTRNAPDRELRQASVTIRLSKEECAQLRQRAAEAEMTVSAYLRSCASEVESLRAQVKEALAGMRSAIARQADGAKTSHAAAANVGAGHDVWLSRILCRVGRLCLGISLGSRS